MNLAFWFCAALVVALAVSVVVIPLLRSGRTGGVAAQTALLREQLDALKSAHAAGLVSAADFESRPHPGKRHRPANIRSRRCSASRIFPRAESRSRSAIMPTKVPSPRETTGTRVTADSAIR
mgnify:CR=1 FL=1